MNVSETVGTETRTVVVPSQCHRPPTGSDVSPGDPRPGCRENLVPPLTKDPPKKCNDLQAMGHVPDGVSCASHKNLDFRTGSD